MIFDALALGLNVLAPISKLMIRQQVHRLARKYHPDKNPDNIEQANQQFRKMKATYDSLIEALESGDSPETDFEEDTDDRRAEWMRRANIIAEEFQEHREFLEEVRQSIRESRRQREEEGAAFEALYAAREEELRASRAETEAQLAALRAERETEFAASEARFNAQLAACNALLPARGADREADSPPTSGGPGFFH